MGRRFCLHDEVCRVKMGLGAGMGQGWWGRFWVVAGRTSVPTLIAPILLSRSWSACQADKPDRHRQIHAEL